MDFDGLTKALGGAADKINAYNEMVLTAEHFGRLADLNIKDEGAVIGGIKMFSSPLVPDGFAVARLNGKVVGVIDFTEKSSWFVTPQV